MKLKIDEKDSWKQHYLKCKVTPTNKYNLTLHRCRVVQGSTHIIIQQNFRQRPSWATDLEFIDADARRKGPTRGFVGGCSFVCVTYDLVFNVSSHFIVAALTFWCNMKLLSDYVQKHFYVDRSSTCKQRKHYQPIFPLGNFQPQFLFSPYSHPPLRDPDVLAKCENACIFYCGGIDILI